MYHYFECPKCLEELSAEVDLGEHLVDWGEECECCNYKFTKDEVLKIYEEALEDCVGKRIDYTHDMMKG